MLRLGRDCGKHSTSAQENSLKARLILVPLLCGLPAIVAAQDQEKPKFEVYGFAMMDAGYNVDQIDPAWFDVVRPTKLPAFENQFPTSGNAYFSARQSRFGVRSTVPTDVGTLKTTFEFELFGTGVDAGQTTFRLRHAYGELGKWGAGQTWSPFMDIDVFPNSVEYWGPTGMVFFRNVQVRYMPIQGDTRMTIALERPGASADQGDVAGRIEIADVKPRFPVPDLSAEYRQAMKDQGTDAFDLSGDALGWGLHASSNVKIGEQNVVRASVVYGEGIQNYMNDAPADVGIETNAGDPVAPIQGVPLPMLGVVAFLDHTWNAKFSSSVGYSMIDIDNSELQSANAFNRGQYALGNLLYYPTPGVMTGVELQWGDRTNFTDGFSSDIFKVQVSFRYNFSKTF
jgi:hypothetical protein